VTKKLRWANARYKEILERQAARKRIEQISFVPPDGPVLPEEYEREAIEDYRAFLHRQHAEREERRLKEVLALKQQEDEEKQKVEDQKKRDVADAAVLEYKLQMKQQEEETALRNRQLEDGLHGLLAKAGVDREKIGRVLKEMKATAATKPQFPNTGDLTVDIQPDTIGSKSPKAPIERKPVFSRYLFETSSLSVNC
jgi:hypothetical protein